MPEPAACAHKHVIIGAGVSGLAVAKNFHARGIAFDCLEREADLGGLWNIATPSGIVYETTHLVSSISSTGFDDLPMLDGEYPEYPSHARVLGYLRDYVAAFGFGAHIAFGKTVERVRQRADALWEVAVVGEAAPRLYRGVVLASGHHDVPRLPRYEGTFTGEAIHSRAYRSPRQVRDKRVLVVGCGNSAADIVSDAVHNQSKVFLSIRRGYWFIPKFVLGFPTGDILSNAELVPLPRLVRRHLYQATLWLLQGPPSRYTLPDPEYAIDQAHPTMSDEIPRLVAHGRLAVKPDIARFEGGRVVFADGTSEAIDLVVFATGYEPKISYIDERLIFGADGRLRLFLRAFHPECGGLYAAGFVQANGSMWRLADYQSQLIANYIVALSRAPERARRFRDLMAAANRGERPGRFVDSDRHRLEVNYFDHRRLLRRHIRRFGAVNAMRLEPVPLAPQPRAPVVAEPAPRVRTAEATLPSVVAVRQREDAR